MAEINPAEVSAILKEELAGLRTSAELEEVGTVLQVGDGIARIYGLNSVQSGELVEFPGGTRGIVLNLEEDNVGVVLLGSRRGHQGGRHREAHQAHRLHPGGRRHGGPRGEHAGRPHRRQGPHPRRNL
jgi:F0F1-type ATP synthase alpha subunit